MVSIEYIAINDKLMCNVKLEKVKINMNIFLDIWRELMGFMLI